MFCKILLCFGRKKLHFQGNMVLVTQKNITVWLFFTEKNNFVWNIRNGSQNTLTNLLPYQRSREGGKEVFKVPWDLEIGRHNIPNDPFEQLYPPYFSYKSKALKSSVQSTTTHSTHSSQRYIVKRPTTSGLSGLMNVFDGPSVSSRKGCHL